MSMGSPAGVAGKQDDDLVSVKELAGELGIAESTAWLHVRRSRLRRFRVPARGKTTLVRRGEAVAAYYRPTPIDRDEDDEPKKAAA
jgi:hypothetical protein